MGISRLTGLIIQSNEVIVTHSKNDEGKFSGWITRTAEVDCRPLLNTEPEFDTAEDAETHMHDVVKKIRAADLTVIEDMECEDGQ